MSVFNAYARYYDLLYRDKDYAGEVRWIVDRIRRHAPNAHTILDLGCGSGGHALLLAQQGYRLCGVDLSDQMIAAARRHQAEVGITSEQIDFMTADLRTLRLDRKFDVVVALFHVMSYQTSDQDLDAAFVTIRDHLQPGGLCIVDCWYGPAVVAERPTVRVKRFVDSGTSVVRIAEPVMHDNGNIVDVNYTLFVRDANGPIEEIRESHRMRYLFMHDLQRLCLAHGLELRGSCEWLTDREPGADTWSVVFSLAHAQAQT